MNSKHVFCPIVSLSLLMAAVAPVSSQDPALATVESSLAANEPIPVAAIVETAESTTTTTTPAPSAKDDYTQEISQSLKERERRLTLLNEAMMKLQEAGEPEDAKRVEGRIKALLAFPMPVQAEEARKEAEYDQLRVRNEDLSLQLKLLQDQLAKLKGESPKKGNSDSTPDGLDLESSPAGRRAEVRRPRS